jgi:multidrug resistance efflux pump
MLIIVAAFFAAAQSPEIIRLRESYIQATKEYRASLEKLRALYVESVSKAISQRDRMKKLRDEGLIMDKDVDQAEAAVADARAKVKSVDDQIRAADQQLAELPSDEQLTQKYKQAVANDSRRAAAASHKGRRRPACRNWSIMAAGKATGGQVSYEVVCVDPAATHK